MDETTDEMRELERAWIEADESAPRAQSISLVNPRHPTWNEDRVLCLPEYGLAAVFDGLGGPAGGEVASRAACGTMALATASLPAAHGVEARKVWLQETLRDGADAIRLSRDMHQDAPAQATTAAALLLTAEVALGVNIGDSRIYLLRDALLTDLTKKDLYYEEGRRLRDLLDEVDSMEALQKDRKLLYAFSERNIVDAELGEMWGLPNDVYEWPLRDGDLFIVCSDGLHDNLTNTEIQAIAQGALGDGPGAVAKALAEAARVRSQDPEHIRAKPDDITVACLKAGEN